MAAISPELKAIFWKALDCLSEAERRAYLDCACKDNAELRSRIDALLLAHQDAGGFLDEPAQAPTATVSPPSALEAPGTVIGPYKLREQIGEGGMGTVFVAEQQHPVRRKVALKIIKPGMDSAQVIARFEAERQALALMDHQNIARVLDAGTTGEVAGGGCRVPGKEEYEAFSPSTRHAPPATTSGRPYFVMELVHGVPISTYCDSNQLTPRQRLELFIPVCLAIQHAHQKGIIHRDIKPSNVLVTMYDDKPVPKVIDFGVAKAIEQRLTEKTVYTQFGTLVGTFEYMSPEQAEMNAFGVDTRSDIYSLGVLLYELLTGTTPLERLRLQQAAYGEIVRLIKEEEPPRPSVRLSTSGALAKVAAARKTDPAKLSRLVRGELDWVVMKCLEKQRTRRYDSAGGLARDIERYLKHEPIEARPPSAGYRFGKFARRHKVTIATAALVAAALVLGTVVSTYQALRATAAEGTARRNEQAAQAQKEEADRARTAADLAKGEAEKRRDELAALNMRLRRARYVADMNVAHHAWAENNLTRTWELLEQHRPRPGEPDLRGFEWHYLRRLFHGELLVVKAHGGEVTTVAFTPDGKQLLSCGINQPRRDMRFTKGLPREIKLWDAATGGQLPLGLQLPPEKARRAVHSPDGARLAAACADKGIWFWDLATGQPSTLERHAKELDDSIGFSPDGKRLVCESSVEGDNRQIAARKARIWDLAARKVVATIEKPPRGWNPPVFSPDGKYLAFADSKHRVVRVFDAATGREAFSCKYGNGSVTHAVFSPDGKRLAGCGEQGIRLWDVSTHEAVSTWPTASNLGVFLAYSSDGQRLAMASIEGVLELWDTGTGQRLGTFNGHAGKINMVAFSPEGTRLASAGLDGTLRVWDATGRREAWSLSSGGSDNFWMTLSPDGQTVAAEHLQTKTIRFWDAATGQPRGEAIPGWQRTADLESFDWTADGRRVLYADPAKLIKVCDAITGKVVRVFPIDADGQCVLAVSPDGNWCAHPVPGGTIKVRHVQTGAESGAAKGLEDELHYLTFSPDGSRLVGADKSGALVIWDRATGRATAATRLSNIYVDRIRFGPEGKRLAVVGCDSLSLVGEVRILDAENGRELFALKGHTLNVIDVAWSPDGERLATGSADHAVRLWDLTTGQGILTLRGHTRLVTSVRFVSDGRRLISASEDGSVRLWDATPVPE
ncbi:MAG: protein kinase domain-containing protein [Isosphaeraceae bacterium]